MKPSTHGTHAQPADALVAFGATGDLAHKKIFPALHAMGPLAANRFIAADGSRRNPATPKAMP